jgi:hypothetical protein
VLPHARRLAALDPYDAEARATLIRLLVGTVADEAEQQYQLGARLLKEVGAEPSGALYAPGAALPGASRTRALCTAARARSTASTSRIVRPRRRARAADGAFARCRREGRAGRPRARRARASARAACCDGSRPLRPARADAFLLEACASNRKRSGRSRCGSTRCVAGCGRSGRDLRRRTTTIAIGSSRRPEAARQRANLERPVVVIFDDLQWATIRVPQRCTTSCA